MIDATSTDEEIDEEFRQALQTMALAPLGAQYRLIKHWREVIEDKRRAQFSESVWRAASLCLPLSYLAMASNAYLLWLSVRERRWVTVCTTLPVMGVIGVAIWLMHVVRAKLAKERPKS